MRRILFCLAFFATFIINNAGADDKNIFYNRSLGLLVVKPDSWKVASAQDHMRNLENVVIQDEELYKRIKENPSLPSLAFIKYPEPYNDINPSFALNINFIGEKFIGKDAKEMISALIPGLQKALKDFQLIEGPSDCEVSSLKAAYIKYYNLMVLADGQSFPSCTEIWIVPRGKILFMITINRRQDTGAEDLQEIKSIVSSIKIEHKEQ